MIFQALAAHHKVMTNLESEIPKMQLAVEEIAHRLIHGGKIFWMGNGGSAADSQHLAAELIGRFKKDRQAIASIALTTDTSILTSLSNDYDFDIIFARQLEALCQHKDIVIGLSTSGNSRNILKGIAAAKEIGAYTIAFCGKGGVLKDSVDLSFNVSSHNTARIQEAHIFIGHCLCELIELKMVELAKAEGVCV